MYIYRLACADVRQMTHNKYFFSGRMMAIRQKPEGGNTRQEFVPEGTTAGGVPVEGPREKDVLPTASSADAFGANAYNLNPMLLEVIRMSDLFWDLAEITTFEKVIDQIYYNVEYATPWEPGTHNAHRATGMQSAVRGVSSAGSPGIAYIFLLKLFIMQLTRQQIKSMLDHPDSPYIRCLGFLYLRIALSDGYKELWSWFEPYLKDPEEFNIDGTVQTKTTMGQYVIRLLTDQDYFGDRLPRIPVLVQRSIDAKLKLLAEGRLTSESAGAPGGAAVAGADTQNDERIKRKRAEIGSLEEKVRELRHRIADKEAELRRRSERD